VKFSFSFVIKHRKKLTLLNFEMILLFLDNSPRIEMLLVNPSNQFPFFSAMDINLSESTYLPLLLVLLSISEFCQSNVLVPPLNCSHSSSPVLKHFYLFNHSQVLEWAFWSMRCPFNIQQESTRCPLGVHKVSTKCPSYVHLMIL
jgi:hypothetical protein